MMRAPIPFMARALLAACLLLALPLGTAAVEEDFEVPGTQPNDSGAATPVIIEHLFSGSDDCQGCHTASLEGSPFTAWRGSLMGNSARDPIFWAQLDLVNYDHNYRPQVAGMGDLCLRCHSPVAWLEGRSKEELENPDDPFDPDGSDIRFTGMLFNQKDMDGVQCHACHRMVDPLLAAENELLDVVNILTPLSDAGELPPTYGNGMFVMDSKHTRRGPYAGDDVTHLSVPDDLLWENVTTTGHPTAQSPFYRSGNLCGTCHDVSNPSDLPEDGTTKGDTQQAFPIERTWTEWRHSDYYDEGIDGGGEANNCQSCHMSGALNSTTYGPVCFGGNDHLNDVHFHDMAGANRFVPMLLKEMSERWRTEDSDFVTAMKTLYPQTNDAMFMGVDYNAAADDTTPADGIPDVGSNFAVWQGALDDTVVRAERSLRRAAYLTVTSDDIDTTGEGDADLVVRVTNRTGHKLPTGYPEGRRMWLNVVFRDSGGTHLGESGYYDTTEASLHYDQNLDGLNYNAPGATPDGESYDLAEYTNATGTPLGEGRPTKVWEARAHFEAHEDLGDDATADGTEFHFALVNHLEWDNRIPPTGWSIPDYTTNRAMPDTDIDEDDANDLYEQNDWQSDYGVAAASGIDYDEFSYPYPTATASDRVELTLYYQTSSREYIETLSNDNPATFTSGAYNRGSLLLEAWGSDLDHPLYGSDVPIGKSSPVEMVRIVHAIVDSDGDGLSDGWEAQYLSGDCSSGAGYNDDPDGDGENNWQEFQAGTNPCSTDPDGRDAVDIVLVLDTSGSMSNAAPGTSTTKLALLKESVELFLSTWKDYAVPDDRLAVVYFDSTVSEYAPGGLPAPLLNAGPVSFVDYWQDALADVQSQAAGGYTAMGGGLHYALSAPYLEDPPGDANALHVILFSNGMQNYSPMVLQPGTDQLEIEDQTPFVDPGVVGTSNIVVGEPPFNVVSADVPIHTIGIGVTGTNSGGDSWHELIADIAEDTGGKHNFITQAYDMEGTFLEDLVEALRGNTLEYVFEEEVQLEGAQASEVEIPINESASKFSVVVSWSESGVGPPDMELLAPNGALEPLALITRGGSFYQITTRYLNDPDAHPEDYGTWTLRLTDRYRHSSAVRVHVLVDDTALKYRFTSPSHLEAGQPLHVSMTALQNDRILRWIDEATVEVEYPLAAVANRISASQLSLSASELASYDPDLTATPYAQKLLAIYDSGLPVVPTQRQSFDLLASVPSVGGLATQGVFTDTLLTAKFPGHYKLHFTMVGHTLTGEHFERKETRSLYVQTRDIDGHLSRVIRTTSETGRDIVHLMPMDERGNLLGPGHASQISIEDDTGTKLLIVDNLDGSYQAELPTSFGTASTLRILVRGKSIHAGTIGADTSAPLTFVSIDRSDGSEAGGLVVNISGRGFLPGASVSFGGVEASDVIVVSDLLIQATVPLGTGDVAIAITNPGGEVTSASETFSYQPVGVIPSDGLPSLDGFGLGGGPVSGNTEPYAQVVVKLDDVAIASFSADVGGRFSGPPNAPIPMVNREYVFGVEAADTSGNSLGQNTYILNTFVARNVARSSEGRDSGQNALVLVGGASQTFRFIANPGDVEISLYAKLTGNVTPAFVVFGGSVESQALTAVGAPDAAGWVRYSALVSVTTGESTTLTLSVSTPLATPVDATVLVDEITIAEQ